MHNFHSEIYDVLLLCSDSNVLPSRESEPSMQMRFVLSGVSSPILIRSLVLMSFMLLKLHSVVAVVTGRTAKIIEVSEGCCNVTMTNDNTCYIELHL